MVTSVKPILSPTTAFLLPPLGVVVNCALAEIKNAEQKIEDRIATRKIFFMWKFYSLIIVVVAKVDLVFAVRGNFTPMPDK